MNANLDTDSDDESEIWIICTIGNFEKIKATILTLVFWEYKI